MKLWSMTSVTKFPHKELQEHLWGNKERKKEATTTNQKKKKTKQIIKKRQINMKVIKTLYVRDMDLSPQGITLSKRKSDAHRFQKILTGKGNEKCEER